MRPEGDVMIAAIAQAHREVIAVTEDRTGRAGPSGQRRGVVEPSWLLNKLVERGGGGAVAGHRDTTERLATFGWCSFCECVVRVAVSVRRVDAAHRAG